MKHRRDRILIIDDEPAVLVTLRGLLQHEDYAVLIYEHVVAGNEGRQERQERLAECRWRHTYLDSVIDVF